MEASQVRWSARRLGMGPPASNSLRISVGEIGECVSPAFGEAASDWGIVGIRVAELVECFAEQGGDERQAAC